MKASTPWQSGNFTLRGSPRLLFGRMYEDAAIDVVAFSGRERIFSIASAGCTAFALAQAGHRVLAVDANPRQVDYVKARLAGAEVQVGAADRLLAVGRRMLACCGWSKARREAFVRCADLVVQRQWWRQGFEPPLRAALLAGLNPLLLSGLYAPVFSRVAPRGFAQVLVRRLRRGFTCHANADNPYAWRLLGLEPLAEAGPLRSTGIDLQVADAATALAAQPPASIAGFTLSNIFDGAPSSYRMRMVEEVRRTAMPGAPVVVRSFSEPRNTAEGRAAAADRSLLWGSISILPAEQFR